MVKKKFLLLEGDSEQEGQDVSTDEICFIFKLQMKICFVGQLKPKFILNIDTKNNLVFDVKN